MYDFPEYLTKISAIIKIIKDEGFDFVGIEREEEYFGIAEARINASSPLFDIFE